MPWIIHPGAHPQHQTSAPTTSPCHSPWGSHLMSPPPPLAGGTAVQLHPHTSHPTQQPNCYWGKTSVQPRDRGLASPSLTSSQCVPPSLAIPHPALASTLQSLHLTGGRQQLAGTDPFSLVFVQHLEIFNSSLL